MISLEDMASNSASAVVDEIAASLAASLISTYVGPLHNCLTFTDHLSRRRTGDAPEAKPAADSQAHGQVVTPWDVHGSVTADGKQMGIDYDKLIDQFGTRRVDQALLERFERLTGHKPHIFLRRGMFFSHR